MIYLVNRAFHGLLCANDGRATRYFGIDAFTRTRCCMQLGKFGTLAVLL